MGEAPTAALRHGILQLQNHSRSRVKLAALGGDGQDVPFEQAFSNLAHAYLRDSAPSLLDYELGFQLLDRNDDNTKAVGVFAFKLGSITLLAPVFFLRGELKGHELLYLKEQDLFVPLKENWLNYLLNRKPNVLGEGVTRQTAELGVLSPDLNQLRESPGKFAACLQEAMPALAHAAQPTFKEAAATLPPRLAAFAESVDLGTFMKQASLPVLELLVKTCTRFPKVAAAFDTWYGTDVLSDAIRAAGTRARVDSILDELPGRKLAGACLGSVLDREHPIKRGALQVITYDLTIQTTLPKGLDEDDGEKLLRDGVLIKDDRDDDEVSTTVLDRTTQVLTNPTRTGLYWVLTKPGKFEKCFIGYSPFAEDGRRNLCTVVRLGDSPDWVNTHSSNVWCGSQIEGKEYTDWFDSLPEVSTLPAAKSARSVLIGPRGHCTCPFNVEKSLGEAKGQRSYQVDFWTDTRGPRPTTAADRSWGEGPWIDNGRPRLHLDGKIGTALRVAQGDMWVPEGFKLLRARAAEPDDMCQPVDCSPPSQSKDSPIQLGDVVSVDMLLFGKRADWQPDTKASITKTLELGDPKLLAGLCRQKTAELKLYNDGRETQINDGARGSQLDALVCLVRDHGLREKAARALLQQAARGLNKIVKTRIKYAEPFLTEEGPIAPAFSLTGQRGGGNLLGYQGTSTQPEEQTLPIPGMSAAMTDRNVYSPNKPDPMDVGTVQDAAASGQKEVFDTAMLGQLLKSVRDDTMVDRYVPKLMGGMDALGRILFSFYWHGGQFAERYGKSDMPELEDALRNSFEQLGDCILFLKQKVIEPYPEEGAVGLDLGDTAELS